MKIPHRIWSQILFDCSSTYIEDEPHYLFKGVDALEIIMNESKTEDIYNLNVIAQDGEALINSLSLILSDIDLEKNKGLKDLYFEKWKLITKYGIHENIKSLKDDKELQQKLMHYYLDNTSNEREISDLHAFRQSLSNKRIRDELMGICKKTLELGELNGKKDKEIIWDYTFYDITLSNEEMLLHAIKNSITEKSDLDLLSKVRFKNKYDQARFDFLHVGSIKSPLVAHKTKENNTLVIKINPASILAVKDMQDIILLECSKYILRILQSAMNLKLIGSKGNKVTFTAENEKILNEAVKIKKVITAWLEENKEIIVDKVLERFSQPVDKNADIFEAGIMVEKIMLQDKIMKSPSNNPIRSNSAKI